MGRLTTRRAVLAGGIALCGTAGRVSGEPSRPQRAALVTSGRGVNILEWIRGTLRNLGYEGGGRAINGGGLSHGVRSSDSPLPFSGA